QTISWSRPGRSVSGGEMIRKLVLAGALCLLLGAIVIEAQTARVIPRPPAQAPGPPNPADGSAAPDGYAPIPAWLGQTRAPRPVKSAEDSGGAGAEGRDGGFCFDFLPDGRIIAGERGGRIRIVAKDGTTSDPIGGMPPNLFVR